MSLKPFKDLAVGIVSLVKIFLSCLLSFAIVGFLLRIILDPSNKIRYAASRRKINIALSLIVLALSNLFFITLGSGPIASYLALNLIVAIFIVILYINPLATTSLALLMKVLMIECKRAGSSSGFLKSTEKTTEKLSEPGTDKIFGFHGGDLKEKYFTKPLKIPDPFTCSYCGKTYRIDKIGAVDKGRAPDGSVEMVYACYDLACIKRLLDDKNARAH